MSTASNYSLLQSRHRLPLMLVACMILPAAPTDNLTGGAGQVAPLAQAGTPIPPSTSAPAKPILLTDPVPDPHQKGVTYFPETGHTLRGEFLANWQQNGGLAQFGYPLTEEFFEPDGPDNSPLQVQYFERNRFELHPENQPPYDVLLGTLGREFRQQEPPAAPEPAPAVYFPETGHNLSGEFLQYWQTHGGLAVNGYPITESATETSTKGKQYHTQWFERSRFELHPENAGSPYEVLLGQLGRQLSERNGYPYGWYPLFGRAIDYSWLAGRYIFDGRSGMDMGCETIKYVQTQAIVSNGTSVRPTGAAWEIGLTGFGPLVPGYMVVFGRMIEDPTKETGGTFTCEAPAYAVDQLQHDPAH